MKNILFFLQHCGERGIENSIYDYAYFNEQILFNKSIICMFNQKRIKEFNYLYVEDVYKKFKNKFQIIEIDNINEIKNICKNHNIHFFYIQNNGKIRKDLIDFNNKNFFGKTKVIKHCVFDTRETSGDYCISISKYLNYKYNTKISVIPYMVNLPITNKEDLREKLKLNKSDIIIGRYGGYTSFDVNFAHKAIKNYLKNNSNIYFLFMNTKKFYEHKNIIYLDKEIDLEKKSQYIKTCDAMLHARTEGETFGLAIAEFSSHNKPVITCKTTINRRGDNEHIRILGDKGIIYHDEESLLNIFKNIKKIINKNENWNCYSKFSPEYVMNMFDQKIFKNYKTIKNDKINSIINLLSSEGCTFIKNYIHDTNLLNEIFTIVKKTVNSIDPNKYNKLTEFDNYYLSPNNIKEKSKRMKKRNKSTFNYRGFDKGRYYDINFLDIAKAELFIDKIKNLDIMLICQICKKLNKNFRKKDLQYNIYYTNSNKNIRTWHYDDKTIKFFIYLSNVEIENGPYSYIKNSIKYPIETDKNFEIQDDDINKVILKNKDKSYQKIIFVGNKGDLIISNQNGIHRGQPQKDNFERMVLVIKYTGF